MFLFRRILILRNVGRLTLRLSAELRELDDETSQPGRNRLSLTIILLRLCSSIVAFDVEFERHDSEMSLERGVRFAAGRDTLRSMELAGGASIRWETGTDRGASGQRGATAAGGASERRGIAEAGGASERRIATAAVDGARSIR